MKLTMKIARKKALQQRLLQLPEDATKGIRVALADAGGQVANAARQFVPVDTGNLRDSIRWQWANQVSYGNQKELAIIIGPDVTKIKDKMTNLPRWVEFGTHAGVKGQRSDTLKKRGRAKSRISKRTHSGTPPQPFLFPAWELYRKSAKQKVGVEVRLAIRSGLKQSVTTND